MEEARHQLRWYMWILPSIVWGVSLLFYFYQYFLRVSVSGMEPQLSAYFHVSAISLSTIAALFYYAYIVMQIPSGILIDRFGPRKMMTLASAILTLGSFLFWQANTEFALDVARACMGVSASFGFVGVLTLSRNWFLKKQFPL